LELVEEMPEWALMLQTRAPVLAREVSPQKTTAAAVMAMGLITLVPLVQMAATDLF
jgi:hypothetical protein